MARFIPEWDSDRSSKTISSALLAVGDVPILLGAATLRNSPKLQLKKDIDAVVKRQQFSKSRWGVHVAELKSGRKLYEHNAQAFIIPASNVKIFTAAAVLHNLGPEYRHKTPAEGVGLAPPVLEELRITGRGDATLTASHLAELGSHLRAQGIRLVKRLVISDVPATPSSTWPLEDNISKDSPPTTSVTVNGQVASLLVRPQKVGQPLKVFLVDRAHSKLNVRNETMTVAASEPDRPLTACLDSPSSIVLRGQVQASGASQMVPVGVPDPRMRLGRVMQRVLEDRSISVDSVSFVSSSALASRPHGPWLFDFLSRPLKTLVDRVLRFSDNLYAEALLRTLGADHKQPYPAFVSVPLGMGPGPSPVQLGLKSVHQTCTTHFGVDASGFSLVDGSGLSRGNAASAESVVQVLRGVALKSPYFNVFASCLPVAGVSGTLRNRMKGTCAEGILRAKTGTLTGVSALSGYVHDLSFSIMLNSGMESSAVLRKYIDEVAILIARYPLLAADLHQLSYAPLK
mmetsp:Transcript_10233/g.16764  ORF Transcript_10233/g.16764 Transcript_10233/m.16764 type:complete len:515 (+) Transcript_10233:152-1696(+)|eukprot:CAMPEP_0184669408 /NCGR_PEP_ID=MMETSP0308-20130426/77215_1 /TAXON_ID=38269 /ORGANISM="Gloeochaete witrockiana, Strain SAG 46.84" /LENGTH=514 /DNA_ID=CAMNT_0027115653 /DNA_START=152 /DNA_END=1696 /DNA_ORIENTATION=-